MFKKLLIVICLLSPTRTYAQPEKTMDPYLNLAISEIENTYGDKISAISKGKTILKFGHTDNADSGVETTVMHLLGTEVHETYLSTNSIAYFSSSSTSDTAITMVVEGHTYSADVNGFQFIVQNITLNGRTKTALGIPLARISRAYNSSSTSLSGDVYFYEDDTVTAGVPQTAAKTHMYVRGGAEGEDQSEKAATTISRFDYLIVTQVYAAGGRGNSSVSFDWYLQRRLLGGLFLPMFTAFMPSALNTQQIQLRPYLIVPKNSDIRMTVISSTDNSKFRGFFSGILATVAPQ